MKLRRIVSSIALTGATALVLTGCMSYKMDVSVNEDKTANVQFSAGYDKAKMKQLLSYDTQTGFGDSDETADEDVCASLQEEAKASGEDVMSDKIAWSETEKECVATVTVENIPFDETGLSESKELSEVANGVQLKSIGDSAQFIYSTASLQESLGGADMQNSMVSWDAILTDFDVTVSFPGEVREANFDGVISEDKRSVAWNVDSLKLALDEGGNLEATGALSAPVNILPFVIGGVLLLVVIGGAAAFFAFRRKDDGGSNDQVADDAAPETTANPVI